MRFLDPLIVLWRTVCRGIAFRTICTGPKGTLLGITSSNQGNKLLQFRAVNVNNGKINFTELSNDMSDIIAMEYFPTFDVLVLATSTQLKGVNLTAQGVLWQWEDQIGNVQLRPKSISRCYPHEWICVANGNSVLIMRAEDGALQEELLRGECVDSAIWCKNRLVTKRKNGTITVYEIADHTFNSNQ